MTLPLGQDLTRDQVEQLVDSGLGWRVTYCWGSHQSPEAGHGAPLPAGVLEHVPTAAALAKLRRGQSQRTHFRAQLVPDGDSALLELTER